MTSTPDNSQPNPDEASARLQARAVDRPIKRTNALKRLWLIARRPSTVYSVGGLLFVGWLAGIAFWGSFNWGMEMTNTESFCVGCHEMNENVFAEYQGTVHQDNHSGVRATCPDCHVPKDWGHKMVRKIRASRELYHHFAGTIDTPEKFEAHRLEMATNVWRTMKETDSRECRNCHNFEYMDFTLQATRAAKAHQGALDAGMTCIDCHQGIAHRLPAGAEERYREITASKHSAPVHAEQAAHLDQ